MTRTEAETLAKLTRGDYRSSATQRVLHQLYGGKALTACEIGTSLWGDTRRGRVSSAWGGGDYAAQMLLGRMRKRGLVRVEFDPNPGASKWIITHNGKDLYLWEGHL